VTELRAVLFDVDFTLAKPGPELGPDGYVRVGARHGLTLEASRYGDARDAALTHLERHPELDHDEEIWYAFTEQIVLGMGGVEPASYECAVEITRGWELHENFELYEDTLPVFEELRNAGLKIGLVTNSARDVHAFAQHHALDIDAAIGSLEHGKTKPHASIFAVVLELLEVEPAAAAMVGDDVEDDIEGARALGMRAILVDRLGRYPGFANRLEDLYGLPAALGLPRPGA
jgi:HAD superfamily hydrolase (TIGR01662 family)